MKHLLFFILFVAFGCQQTTFLETENLKTSESEKGCEQQTISNEQKSPNAQSSQLEAQSLKKTVDCCPLSVDYYEKQIHIADSLYKNYLPQYNFEEVKAAVGFFDSLRLTTDNSQQTTDFFHRFRKNKSSQYLSNSQTLCNSDAYPRTVDCCPLTVDIDFIYAKAHYYHAVGLTERDDIVGACEHYLTALEIMEELMSNDKRLKAKGNKSVDNPEDYEKIKFLSLIYTRLGELFYSENNTNLALYNYRVALKYKLLLGEDKPVANTYKCLGNSYQLCNMLDSALYYYNKSLEASSALKNRLDVEKCIAQILFKKGEKDSAYIMIRKNLDKIENANVRCSYYNILGEMYIYDKEYDSAIYYLTKSISSNISNIKVYSAIKLSAIYDSIGDNTKKAYYDDIVSKISISDINKNIETNKLQDVYDKYKERKAEKEKSMSRLRTKVVVIPLSAFVFMSLATIILIWHKYKRKDIKYIESLNEKDRYIAGKETDIKKMESDLSVKERELKKLQENVHENKILIDKLNEDNVVKEKQIERYLEEIEDNRREMNYKNRLISIATKGLVERKDAITENRNEIAKLQAIICENDKVINKLSKDYITKEEQIAVYLEETERLKTEITETRSELNDLRFRSSLTEGRIKSQNAELKKKDELIKEYMTEISNLKNGLERKHIDISNLNNYLHSEVCSKILNEINDLSARNKNTNRLTPLRHEEFIKLFNSANYHLNHLIIDMANKHPKLKKEDLYYLCLAVIGLSNDQISSLFGVTYHASKKRKDKICVILGIDSKESLHNYLLHLI